MIDPIFAELAAFLPRPDRRGARAPGRLADADPVRRRRRSSGRRRCRTRLAVAVGHDPDNFRIDSAPHPFSVPHSPGDVRFTTRYDVDNVRVSPSSPRCTRRGTPCTSSTCRAPSPSAPAARPAA